MSRDGQIFELPKKSSLVADLFTTQEQRDDAKRERVTELPLSEIGEFPNHPFHVREDEELLKMAESIREYGVLNPAIVRPKAEGGYEMVSGHRRMRACELAGICEIPCLVRELSDDEAVILMVDANIQREIILPSEKAQAYKMKLEAIKRQGQRTDLTSSPVGMKLDGKQTLDIIGESAGDSRNQVHRYIRLTELTPELLHMVDESAIAFRPAVELSYLRKEEQAALAEAIVMNDGATPSLAQAIKMKQFSQSGRLDENVILSIMAEEKPNQREKVSIPREKINRFFKDDVTPQQIEDTIIKALELYRQRERSRQSGAR